MKRSSVLLILLLVAFTGSITLSAKKIKSTFRIEKENIKNKDNVKAAESDIRFDLQDTESPDSLKHFFSEISFAGYEKEISSSVESFLVINGSDKDLSAITVRIDYFDLQGRMIHSRDYTVRSVVPAGQTRKIDIPSWDRQRTYYYYLGNEPKKVATPYKVTITPVTYWQPAE
ncbi:MAG: hypothetical protein J1E95_02140 [Muribaculaceae bacterium]|nr:hypothetical protein [Muribaculaceae bacterium]